MKLSKGTMVTVSFMLFSLFFGAGNLIFPPFLGQSAANQTIPAILGFLITAVVLPVLGVVVVARFDGLDRLSRKVGKYFALVFTVLIYLYNLTHIVSDEGFGKNDYIETTRPLVVITAPGPGSGKMVFSTRSPLITVQ